MFQIGPRQTLRPIFGFSLLPFFEKDSVINQVHLSNSSFDSFLFSKDILKVELVLFWPKDGDVLQNQFLLSFFYQVCICLTHEYLL